MDKKREKLIQQYRDYLLGGIENQSNLEDTLMVVISVLLISLCAGSLNFLNHLIVYFSFGAIFTTLLSVRAGKKAYESQVEDVDKAVVEDALVSRSVKTQNLCDDTGIYTLLSFMFVILSLTMYVFTLFSG